MFSKSSAPKTPKASTDDAGRTGGRRQAILLCALGLPFLIGMYALVLGYWARPVSTGQELRLDQFLDVVAKHRVGTATILAADDRVIGTYDGRYRYWVDFAGGHETLFARITGALDQAGVPTNVQSQPLKSLVQPVSMLFPMLILADVMVLLALVAKGGGQLGGFSRAAARQIGDGEPTFTFADLAGADEAVEGLAELRDYLADPSRFAHMGAAVPKGVLLSGPPGCGKTRLARAVAGESAVPFFSISGSLATRRLASAIATADFTEPVERVVAGPQRHTRILTPADSSSSPLLRTPRTWGAAGRRPRRRGSTMKPAASSVPHRLQPPAPCAPTGRRWRPWRTSWSVPRPSRAHRWRHCSPAWCPRPTPACGPSWLPSPPEGRNPLLAGQPAALSRSDKR